MSLLDIDNNIKDNHCIITKWLDENCDIYADDPTRPYEIVNDIVNVYGTVAIKNKKIEYIPIQFGIVTKNFNCYGCSNLKSLEGSPHKATRFDCSDCDSLTNLIGGPREVNYYYCYGCHGLTSLKGGPDICRKLFDCTSCSRIKTFDWESKYPAEYMGRFDFSDCISLISFDGFPFANVGELKCCNCNSLNDMSGFPKVVRGDLNCAFCCDLKSITGIPIIILGDMLLNRCNSLNITEKIVRNKSYVKGEVYV